MRICLVLVFLALTINVVKGDFNDTAESQYTVSNDTSRLIFSQNSETCLGKFVGNVYKPLKEWYDEKCHMYRCEPVDGRYVVIVLGCAKPVVPAEASLCQTYVVDAKNVMFPNCCPRLRCVVVVNNERYIQIVGQPEEYFPMERLIEVKTYDAGDDKHLEKSRNDLGFQQRVDSKDDVVSRDGRKNVEDDWHKPNVDSRPIKEVGSSITKREQYVSKDYLTLKEDLSSEDLVRDDSFRDYSDSRGRRRKSNRQEYSYNRYKDPARYTKDSYYSRKQYTRSSAIRKRATYNDYDALSSEVPIIERRHAIDPTLIPYADTETDPGFIRERYQRSKEDKKNGDNERGHRYKEERKINDDDYAHRNKDDKKIDENYRNQRYKDEKNNVENDRDKPFKDVRKVADNDRDLRLKDVRKIDENDRDQHFKEDRKINDNVHTERYEDDIKNIEVLTDNDDLKDTNILDPFLWHDGDDRRENPSYAETNLRRVEDDEDDRIDRRRYHPDPIPRREGVLDLKKEMKRRNNLDPNFRHEFEIDITKEGKRRSVLNSGRDSGRERDYRDDEDDGIYKRRRLEYERQPEPRPRPKDSEPTTYYDNVKTNRKVEDREEPVEPYRRRTEYEEDKEERHPKFKAGPRKPYKEPYRDEIEPPKPRDNDLRAEETRDTGLYYVPRSAGDDDEPRPRKMKEDDRYREDRDRDRDDRDRDDRGRGDRDKDDRDRDDRDKDDREDKDDKDERHEKRRGKLYGKSEEEDEEEREKEREGKKRLRKSGRRQYHDHDEKGATDDEDDLDHDEDSVLSALGEEERHRPAPVLSQAPTKPPKTSSNQSALDWILWPFQAIFLYNLKIITCLIPFI